jgi:hypothetical protein
VGFVRTVPCARIVSPDLPAEFARSAAYGDLIAAILALLALAHQETIFFTNEASRRTTVTCRNGGSLQIRLARLARR